jgi:hypothetical protein
MKTGINQLSVAVSNATSTPILSESPYRVAIIFSAGITNRYSVSFGQAAVDRQGVTMHPLTDPVILTRKELGDAITQRVEAIFNAAGETIAVSEFVEVP